MGRFLGGWRGGGDDDNNLLPASIAGKIVVVFFFYMDWTVKSELSSSFSTWIGLSSLSFLLLLHSKVLPGLTNYKEEVVFYDPIYPIHTDSSVAKVIRKTDKDPDSFYCRLLLDS